MRESSAIHKALGPIVALAYEAVSSRKKLYGVLEVSREHSGIQSLLAALRNLSTRAPAFPDPILPSMYQDVVLKARLEADAMILLLGEDLESTSSEDNQNTQHIKADTLSVPHLLGGSFTDFSKQRTIFLLSEIDLRSREEWGPSWKYKFHIHGTSEMKHGIDGPEKISFSVAMKEGGTADQLAEVAKFMPDGHFVEGMEYVVGLSAVERQLLSLNPLVKDIKPWKSEFQMSLAFD